MQIALKEGKRELIERLGYIVFRGLINVVVGHILNSTGLMKVALKTLSTNIRPLSML